MGGILRMVIVGLLIVGETTSEYVGNLSASGKDGTNSASCSKEGKKESSVNASVTC